MSQNVSLTPFWICWNSKSVEHSRISSVVEIPWKAVKFGLHPTSDNPELTEPGGAVSSSSLTHTRFLSHSYCCGTNLSLHILHISTYSCYLSMIYSRLILYKPNNACNFFQLHRFFKTTTFQSTNSTTTTCGNISIITLIHCLLWTTRSTPSSIPWRY